MRFHGTRIRKLVAAAAALAGAAALALPGQAANAVTDSTTVTFSLSAGLLSIDAPASASGSGSSAPLSTINAAVADTTVSDNRGSLAGWAVTATATDLVKTGAPSVTLDQAAMTWTTDSLGVVLDVLNNPLGSLGNGAVAVGLGGQFADGVSVPVAAAAPLAGSGSYVYDATVTLVVPVGAQAGTYTTTITQTAI